ncbi:MAG TPA: PhpK family radical SAM P-methyltransferase, partial [Candidatus Deferrimicrobium sp.]|nr:PhpK family radical SAM P-methyltransferase [Candidatus Deferrimicrobium sp.]
LNFIRYNNRPYSISEIFNMFNYRDEQTATLTTPVKPLHVAESFSAAIAYLGSYLAKRGYRFDYVNSFQYGKEVLKEKLSNDDILVVAIITTLYVSVLPIVEIINFIKAFNRTARIIVGGPFISTNVRTLAPEELGFLLESTIGADFYVNSSQGETALVNIIDALKNNKPLDAVHNIYYKTANGINATDMVREDNRIAGNRVDWNLFKDNVGEYVNARTAISCPFSCSFCGFPQHSGRYQTAPVEEIEKELTILDKIGTVKDVHFIDDTFNIPVQRFKNILRMMIKNKFSFKWHSYFRCQYADREMVELMKASGCEGVFLGIESGNNRILKNMNKAADTGRYAKGIELLKENGIITFGNFIIGFPGETDETVRDTVDFIETRGLDFFRVQLWYCEPITPIWKQKEIYGIQGESFEWSHASMDSRKACDLVEEIFFNVKKSTWVPQYNFDFDTFWHLYHRGMPIEKIRQFLESFNLAVKEKLKEPFRKEAGYESLERIKNACSLTGIDTVSTGEVPMLVDKTEAEFEFL